MIMGLVLGTVAKDVRNLGNGDKRVSVDGFDDIFQLGDLKAVSYTHLGYKALTDSDLGRSSSHQTHIGLFDDILTFLPNSIEIPDAMVIYNGNIEFLTANFDRIERANGQFNSPKIKTGGRYTVSVDVYKRQHLRSSLEWNDPQARPSDGLPWC